MCETVYIPLASPSSATANIQSWALTQVYLAATCEWVHAWSKAPTNGINCICAS
eukprot:CAMPEP_0177568700 /NCGR_PEP_ID=MMETSP0369-20130122/75914_1 /TAXON_ID=447022 ORGANISM="Scrippsiella hangoei-like, Strain SHHI-4" /NCGR_SAMPLE_ID=MMETSP0369 /ASSEMBLY_ACC=CAM_ASM_000364 /LENGTH=53 /DNA_ID=CAMNT_0019056323 /DNA_START=8 /DNA_END=165 /DNA_ORIENTATION=-